MPRSGTALRRPGQSGQSLILVLVTCSILAVLVGAVVRQSQGTTSGTVRDARGDVALQAADAGVSRYVSRLVTDPLYWSHYVDQAEDTRLDPTDGNRAYPPGSAWPAGKTTWTYSTNSWTDIQPATDRFGKAQYRLRITPPSNSDVVTIRSVGRTLGSGANVRTRAVQAQVRPGSLADFQALSNTSISYGSTATTTGKIYSAANVTHDGTAKGTVYALSRVTGNSSFEGGRYDSTTNPTTAQLYPSGVPFSQFTDDLADIKTTATAQGNLFNDATAKGWLVQFTATGQANIWRITSGTSAGLASALPTFTTAECNSSATYSRTINNFSVMWFTQPVVIGSSDNPCTTTGALDSVVDGRVTIGTADDVYVGGNISYETSGDDALGLIATSDLIITNYAPSTLTWRAATLAQTGQWKTNLSDGSHTKMTFTGSQAMYNGGSAGMFASRLYNYDDTLVYQRPPLFPTIEGTWETVYWREVDPTVA
jgi:hypothetical protein